MGRSTRAARDRARAADRRPGGVAAGAFVICLGSAALWVHRVGARALGGHAGVAWSLIAVGLTAVALYSVVIQLDLTTRTSELSGRLRLELRLARRLDTADDVLSVLHDCRVDGSATLSHVVLTPGGIDVVVDASPATWSPWRPKMDSSTASACLWRAWVDASAGAVAIRRALADTGLAEAASAVEPVVVTDAEHLPLWAAQLPFLHVTDMPRPHLRALRCDTGALAARLPDLTTPADPPSRESGTHN